MAEHASIPGIYTPSWLEVIAGCMRSSKTEEFRLRFAKCEHSNIGHLRFQPYLNSRDEGDTITSRNGLTFEAKKIINPYDILGYVTKDILVVGIEEAEFFPKTIEDVVNQLLLQRKNVVIAGLDADAERRSFGSMDYFLREADDVKKVHAVCEDCREQPAKYSYYKGGKDQQIVVGDEQYLVLCRQCYGKRTP